MTEPLHFKTCRTKLIHILSTVLYAQSATLTQSTVQTHNAEDLNQNQVANFKLDDKGNATSRCRLIWHVQIASE